MLRRYQKNDHGIILVLFKVGRASSLFIATASLIHSTSVLAQVPNRAVGIRQALQALAPQPTILEPVTYRDPMVLVSGVSPGDRVLVFRTRTTWKDCKRRTEGQTSEVFLGSAWAKESIVRVKLHWQAPVGCESDAVEVFARTKRPGVARIFRTSPRVQALPSPCGNGPDHPVAVEAFPGINERNVPFLVNFCGAGNTGNAVNVGECLGSFGNFSIHKCEYQHPIRGALYFPRNYRAFKTNLPLIIVAHGNQAGMNSGKEGYLGYDYFARQLARWGAFVYSIDLREIEKQRDYDQQEGRARLILEAVRRVMNHPVHGNRIDKGRVGLVGHSMSGEAVIWAKELSKRSAFNIRGIVSMAPSSWNLTKPALRNTRFLLLFGSKDYILLDNPLVPANGNLYYDKARTLKSHVWIYGGTHDSFNSKWSDDSLSLSAPRQRHIAKCLINAFFVEAFQGDEQQLRPLYAGYLQGTILPPSIRQHRIFMQHRTTNRRVVRIYSHEEATNYGGNFAFVRRRKICDRSHDTFVLELGWSDRNARYSYSLSSGVNTEKLKFLSLRVMQYPDRLNQVGKPQDFSIALSDGRRTAKVRVGSVATIPYPDTSRNELRHLPMLRTIRLPLNAFKAVDPLLNLRTIKRVDLLFDVNATGAVHINDIEFTP